MSDQPQHKDRQVLVLSGEAFAHLCRIINGEIPYTAARPGDDPCPLCEEIRSALIDQLERAPQQNYPGLSDEDREELREIIYA